MNDTKYIGMDVHRESISIAIMNSAGKIVLACVVMPTAHDTNQVIPIIPQNNGSTLSDIKIDGFATGIEHDSDEQLNIKNSKVNNNGIGVDKSKPKNTNQY
jgi:hypothetical protein